MEKMNSLHSLIQAATGATGGDLVLLENIMREEIFHSTLDWQTRDQLIDGARQAQERLEADRDWYVLERRCRKKILQQMQGGTNPAAN